jgi:hypothetical protein
MFSPFILSGAVFFREEDIEEKKFKTGIPTLP